MDSDAFQRYKLQHHKNTRFSVIRGTGKRNEATINTFELDEVSCRISLVIFHFEAEIICRFEVKMNYEENG